MGFFNNAKKLQLAINKTFDKKVLLCISQWYSDKKKITMNVYSIKEVTTDESGKKKTVELFHTYSVVQLVLFLRDYWYELNGLEVPTDDKIWQENKAKYARKQQQQPKYDE